MYCSKKRVKQYEFDAIGQCCYFIAAKAIEMDPPTYSKLTKKTKKGAIPLEDWLVHAMGNSLDRNLKLTFSLF
jgi:hypothetical protein